MTQLLRVEAAKESLYIGEDGTWRTVWGHVLAGHDVRAVYYVRWNDTLLGDAEFVVSVGEWEQGGEGAPIASRDCVVARGKKHQGRLAFMLIDAEKSSFAEHAFLGAMKTAADVRGTALAQHVFRILDEILVQDERVRALRERLEA